MVILPLYPDRKRFTRCSIRKICVMIMIFCQIIQFCQSLWMDSRPPSQFFVFCNNCFWCSPFEYV
ncbi:DUF1240 domain-containing protein [Paenibacillus anaericanus]|uniref:DUF1240 domain-containing protein n=1 Tax=Paenibacillus anaericanus TaxID=170367 RepID=A0A433Y7M2_9BACL|nr:DUF1240 domain-containing protein [Paenibacillus anaericanus]